MKINLKKYFNTINITKFCNENNIKKRTFEDIYYEITLNPRIDILYKIAKALNVKVDDLIEE